MSVVSSTAYNASERAAPRAHAGLWVTQTLLTRRAIDQIPVGEFSDVGGYPRKISKMTEKAVNVFNNIAAFPPDEYDRILPANVRVHDVLVDGHFQLPNKYAISINSVYYDGVLECLARHIHQGGVAYVVCHCCNHSGVTWGDEAEARVEGEMTTLTTGESGTGYRHRSLPYADYAEFQHRGVWFRAINRVLVGCCHTMGLY